MKKGSAGTRKMKKLTSGKSRITAAKTRIKKVLAKAQPLVRPLSKSPKKATKNLIVSRNRQTKSAVKRVSGPRGLAQAISKKQSTAPVSSRADLPFSYNQTRLELMVRDPEWAYAWWDFSGETWKWMMKLFAEDSATCTKLRIHNLSHATSYDLDVHLDAKNWYVNLGFPDTEFEAELGLLDSKGRFHRIAKSNRVRTPRNGASTVIDPRWDPSEFSDLEQLSGKSSKPFGASASLFSAPRVRKS